jgi:hypothetical protein
MPRRLRACASCSKVTRRRTSASGVTFRPANGHISANSNSALDLAGGDYVALLDADDVLTEDALFWVAHEIALDPQTDMIFSDEDKIGRRRAPRRPLLQAGLESRADARAECVLPSRRLSPQPGRAGRPLSARAARARRTTISRCAAPTRRRPSASVTSRAFSITGARPRSPPRRRWRQSRTRQAAGLSTIEDHLRRRGINGSVESAGNFYQVIYQVPEPAPLVSIIVPTTLRNSITQQLPAIGAGRNTLREFRAPSARDRNRSLRPGARHSPTACRRARARADLRVRRRSTTPGSTISAPRTRAEACCVSSTTTWKVISEDWLDTLVARASFDGVGAAGPMLYYPSEQDSACRRPARHRRRRRSTPFRDTRARAGGLFFARQCWSRTIPA